MAIPTWGRSLLVALGVSVLAGAGQLGIAYGLGILRFTRTFADAPDHWPAQLVWVGWFAVGATVVGAVLADRYARRNDLPVTTVVQVTIAVAATLGATVVAPLCMLPARNAQVPAVDPVLSVAVSALFGALAGTVAAVAVLRYAAMSWNAAVSTAALGLLALLSVVPSLGAADPLPTVRLGALDPVWLAPDTAGRLAMLILPGLALLVGAAVAGVARWRGQPPLLGGLSGVTTPVVVAVAYLLAGPGRGDDGFQSTPYRAALLAVLTGALGSVAAAVLRRPPLSAAALLRWPPLAGGRSRSDAIEPTDILRPLPAGTGLPPVPSPARPADDADPFPASTVSDLHVSDLDASDLDVSDLHVSDPAGTDPNCSDPTGVGTGTGPDASDPTGTGPAIPDPAHGVSGESSGSVGPQPIGRLPWQLPQPTGTDRSRTGTWDWPSPPGTAETVSTTALDWSLPTPDRSTGSAGPDHTDGAVPDPVHLGRELPGLGQTGPADDGGPPEDTDRTTATGSVVDGDATTDGTGPAGDAPATGGFRKLRDLLRRDRPGAGATGGSRSDAAGGRERDEPALPPQDEEYVDWVAQLGQPTPDTTTFPDPGERRTLRSTGRHQRD
ncbi:hypothetical protein [Micromonospora sagamiensis]|uniref:Uncharacterized protein n=1 Tax=Micromonospora sagamiensis TaxID=47875 RepID=A0A562WAH8_9ACTN|nr:hypothetical protein [Micromonospora sagamiensis]TWJ27115.1 hypothetical protein JD81_00602 [Micromonospora sagamiensis]BCL13993.1 hypothetical protein GCM10017556_17320 [Micromonospora sagamiensis]